MKIRVLELFAGIGGNSIVVNVLVEIFKNLLK